MRKMKERFILQARDSVGNLSLPALTTSKNRVVSLNQETTEATRTHRKFYRMLKFLPFVVLMLGAITTSLAEEPTNKIACDDQPSNELTKGVKPNKKNQTAEDLYQTGLNYFWGRGGVELDEAKAIPWFEKAAKQGHAEAQARLGFCYSVGRGVAEDDAKAFQWYEKAAKQGHTEAQYHLGDFYDSGRGVAEDEAKALQWYEKAAKQGHTRAPFRVALKFQYGVRVDKNYVKALEWYEEHLVRNGECEIALKNIGDIYAEGGYGIHQNLAKAREYYQRAADEGYEEAKEVIRRINSSANYNPSYNPNYTYTTSPTFYPRPSTSSVNSYCGLIQQAYSDFLKEKANYQRVDRENKQHSQCRSDCQSRYRAVDDGIKDCYKRNGCIDYSPPHSLGGYLRICQTARQTLVHYCNQCPEQCNVRIEWCDN